MTFGFTYMGSKRQMANLVSDVIDRAPQGPLLDAFAGMSAVGAAIAPSRPIWCNDIQHFAYNVARTAFTSPVRPEVEAGCIAELRSLFELNGAKLERIYGKQLSAEARAFASNDHERVRDISARLVRENTSRSAAILRSRYRKSARRFPYRLFSCSYAGGYVGLAQAIEIDSIRFAIDSMQASHAINEDEHRWMVVALCRALSRSSNSTGHFAQYLTVKEHTVQRFLAKRRRSIWDEWLVALRTMFPLGNAKWRRSNRVFRQDATVLIRSLSRHKRQPAVIYCDPPYSADHYSRYYHLVETLILYDYPSVSSKGLYRADRFSSPFSIKTTVEPSFRALIDAASSLQSTFVLSYPDRGLLPNSRNVLVGMLREKFRKVQIAAEFDHRHSSLGASKGVEKSPATEIVFLAHT